MIGEHTDSDRLRDRVLNGETTHREVNILQVTSRTMANPWLLFKLVWLRFNYPHTHRSACKRQNTHMCSHSHMHRLPVWSLADSCSDPTLMQPCRGLSAVPGLPRAQADARCTPPYQQSCCQTTQGDSKWEQRVLFSFLTHTHTHTHTMWFILSDSYPHTHTTHIQNTMQAGRQQLGVCWSVNYSILAL